MGSVSAALTSRVLRGNTARAHAIIRAAMDINAMPVRPRVGRANTAIAVAAQTPVHAQSAQRSQLILPTPVKVRPTRTTAHGGATQCSF